MKNIPSKYRLRLPNFCSKHPTLKRCISGLPGPISMRFFFSFESTFQFQHISLMTEAIRAFLKVTVQFERCFRLMEHISVSSCRNPINLYITEKLIKFSKSLFNFYLVISNI